ncbi:MAG: ribonuclease J [Chloroflexi bacterium]|nr:ribonuclease J [Chloroflexota bacterium]
MLVLEYADSLLIIDAGLMFPQNDMLGIDIVIPDLQYVFDRVDQVKAIIITHGHEDHVGALPYLLERVHAPIYATRLTRGLIEVKLREAKITDADMRTIAPNDVLDLFPFEVEFFHVSHSIPDGVGLAIETPVGLVVHSGDFKFDHSPVDGQRTDFAKLADLGGRGVLLLLSDSTNSERPGYTPSEQVIAQTFERVFEAASGRVIVATFASNISRVQQVLDTAQAAGRRVAVVGRSMVSNVKIARELGYLHVPDDVLITIDQIGQYPDHEVALVCTGSQGEPTSALVRMSRGEFRSVQLMPGDTVIVSATPIPGNEELINHTLDNLFRLGAHVFYDEVLDVHVSGHASQEEQKLLLNLMRPLYFVPIHGEYRHLILHSQLARQCGVAEDHALVMETGDVLEIDQDGAEIVDKVSDSYVFVDGLGVGGDGQSVLNERRSLSENGFLVVAVSLDKYTGGLVGEPQIISRGFVYEAEAEDLLELAKAEAVRAVELGGSRTELTERLAQNLARLAHKQTGRQPIVVPIVSKL